MSVYVGIDVHRKRSQLAVVDQDGEVLANRNVTNGMEPILAVIGDLPVGTPAAFEPRSAGDGWSSCSRTTASTRTWCTRRGARRSPRPG
jgi:transposase